MHRWSRGFLVAGSMVSALTGVGVWTFWQQCGVSGCPDVRVLERQVRDEAPVVLDRRGRELARLYRVPRVIVPLDSLPDYVPAAFVAVEDQRFWQHGGVDWRRVGGAAFANLRAGEIRQGFSTITMQLARNVFPDHLPYAERSLWRKLAEMRVAREIEKRYTKRQILELYLNQIYFGSGAWGIEAAARAYFGKPAVELDLAEAALLAGVIAAPDLANPRNNPHLAVGRRGVVLELMAAVGVISQEQSRAAAAARLVTRTSPLEAGRRAPYFVEEIRRLLERELGESLYTRGYTIHTTLDLDVQTVVEAELQKQLRAVETGAYGDYRHAVYKPASGMSGPRGTDYLQGAAVVLEAQTGDVLALVGGRDFTDSRYNRATRAKRQPASTFKPFVYAAALARGSTPADQLNDLPLRREVGGEIWAPRNFENRYADSLSLRDALVLSSNVATIRLAEQVGLTNVIAMARKLGLDGPFPAVPSLALGTAEVSLLDLTVAYAAFATLGRLPEPRTVTEVRDAAGRVVWRQEPRSREVLDPRVAFLITDIMRDVVDRGTGRQVRAVGFRGPAAGKTGTTNNATDVWFVGYTPTRVAGIWIGLDAPKSIARKASGDLVAAPVWGRIMKRTTSRTEQEWRPPRGIVARRMDDAGHVFGVDCDGAGHLRTEYFLVRNAPRAGCPASIPPGR